MHERRYGAHGFHALVPDRHEIIFDPLVLRADALAEKIERDPQIDLRRGRADAVKLGDVVNGKGTDALRRDKVDFFQLFKIRQHAEQLVRLRRAHRVQIELARVRVQFLAEETQLAADLCGREGLAQRRIQRIVRRLAQRNLRKRAE